MTCALGVMGGVSAQVLTMVVGLLSVARVGLAAQTVKSVDASGREITRHCRRASAKALPPVSAVLDSSAVAQALAGLTPADAPGWRFALAYPRDAATPSIRWMEPETGADTVIRILTAAALSRRDRTPWAVRLSVGTGPVPNLTLEPALYCSPHPMPSGPPGLAVRQRVEVQPGDRLPSVRRIRIVAEVEVLETGAVVDVRLMRGSGLRDLDDSILRHFSSTRFLPALLDGLPVPGRYRSDGSSPWP